MPKTVSIIHLDGEPKSVAAERKQHSDWVKQEAQILMDELFVEVQEDLDRRQAVIESAGASGKDWDVDLLPPPQQYSSLAGSEWKDLEIPSEDNSKWLPEVSTPPFYHRLLWIFGGLAVLTPLSLWASTSLQEAAHQKSVTAATPTFTAQGPSLSDKEFAKYAEKALQNITTASDVKSSGSINATSLPPLPIASIPSVLPPIASGKAPEINAAIAPKTPITVAKASQSPVTPPAQAVSKPPQQLALKVLPPQSAPKQASPSTSLPTPPTVATPSIDSAATSPAKSNSAENSSSITPAPSIGLPSLSAEISEPVDTVTTIAAATPMTSPENSSHKVIGIIELGLQSTLMVSHNGSHLNFQVGDIINNDGWKLAQISDGKAILQKGTEYKTLSEGQLF